MIQLAPEEGYDAWMAQAEAELSLYRMQGRYRGFDGASLRWEGIRPPHARATVVILHGFTEFPEKYRELCRYFFQAGCAVYLPLLAWPRHGAADPREPL